MFERLRAMLHHHAEAAEIDALTDRDLDDLGMTRDQLRAFLRMPKDIGQRVTAMAAIFGVSEVELKRDHSQWLDLLTVCGHCADRAACASELAKGEAAHAADCGFCGNRESFGDLRRRPAPVAAR